MTACCFPEKMEKNKMPLKPLNLNDLGLNEFLSLYEWV